MTTKNVLLYHSRHTTSLLAHLRVGTRVSKVAKKADTAKKTKNCTNCMSARPTPLHTDPMESGPKNFFLLKIKKDQKIHDF